jgi:hypothetical protein
MKQASGKGNVTVEQLIAPLLNLAAEARRACSWHCFSPLHSRMKWIKIAMEAGDMIMRGRLPVLFSRACLGILLILNGPGHGLAIGLDSACSFCSCSAANSETPVDQKHSRKRCCGRCSSSAQANTKAKDSTSKNRIRPTCPVCPACPSFPGDCCVSCPCKAPCSPPLVFVIPEAPELAWRLADVSISFCDSHTDEPILPPRFAQFVPITI